MAKTIPYLSVLVIIAALYTGYIMFSRWQEHREGERAAKQAEAQRAKETIDMLGGDKMRIIQFSVEPAIVKPGARALVCYGVTNATTVRIDPPIEDITPSLSRCLEIHPKRTTEYKMTAEDGFKHTVTKSLVVKVE